MAARPLTCWVTDAVEPSRVIMNVPEAPEPLMAPSWAWYEFPAADATPGTARRPIPRARGGAWSRRKRSPAIGSDTSGRGDAAWAREPLDRIGVALGSARTPSVCRLELTVG